MRRTKNNTNFAHQKFTLAENEDISFLSDPAYGDFAGISSENAGTIFSRLCRIF